MVLIGRLTKEVEGRYTPNGKCVASFTIAVDRPFKNQQGEKETDFINIVVWGKQGENCMNYLSKGKLCCVDGRLQIRSYDGQDGQKKWITEVVAQDVRFLSPKDSNNDNLGFGGSDFDDDSIPF